MNNYYKTYLEETISEKTVKISENFETVNIESNILSEYLGLGFSSNITVNGNIQSISLYDFEGITEIKGDLILRNNKKISSLGKDLISVNTLDLENSSIKDLGNLERAERWLILKNTLQLKSLGNSLNYVGKLLILKNSLISDFGTGLESLESLNIVNCLNLNDLGNLKFIGDNLLASGSALKTLGNIEYLGNYSDFTGCLNLNDLGNLKAVSENAVIVFTGTQITYELIMDTCPQIIKYCIW